MLMASSGDPKFSIAFNPPTSSDDPVITDNELSFQVTVQNEGGALTGTSDGASFSVQLERGSFTNAVIDTESVILNGAITAVEYTQDHIRVTSQTPGAGQAVMPKNASITFTVKGTPDADAITNQCLSFSVALQKSKTPDLPNIDYADRSYNYGKSTTYTLKYYRSSKSSSKDETVTVWGNAPARFTVWGEATAASKGIKPSSGKELAGWSKTPNDSTVAYKPGQTLTTSDTEIPLYAVWQDKAGNVSVTYCANNGTNEGPYTETVARGSTVAIKNNSELSAPFTAPAGKVFIGWSKDNSNSNKDTWRKVFPSDIAKAKDGDDLTNAELFEEGYPAGLLADKAQNETLTENLVLSAVWDDAREFGYSLAVPGTDFPGGETLPARDPYTAAGHFFVLDDGSSPQTLWYYENTGKDSDSGARKYKQYAQKYGYSEKVTVTKSIPTASDSSLVFLAWYNKKAQVTANKGDSSTYDKYDLNLTSGSNFIYPGDTFYFGHNPVYTIDAIWGRLTVPDSVVVYDGTAHGVTADVTLAGEEAKYSINEILDPSTTRYDVTVTTPGSITVTKGKLTAEQVSSDPDLKFTDSGVYTYTVTATVTLNTGGTGSARRTAEISTTATLAILPRPVRITGEAERPWTGQPQTVYFTIGSPSGVPAGADKETPDYLLDETAFNAFKAAPAAGSYYDALTPELKTAAGKLTPEQRDALTLTGDPVVSRDASFTYLHSLTETAGTMTAGTMTGTGGTCTLNKANYIVTDEVNLTIVSSTATANLTVEKNFAVGSGSASGTTLPAQRFTFTLVGPGSADGVTVSSNTLDIEVSQSQPTNTGIFTLTFDRPGKYKYTVTETNDGVPGVGYDTDSPRSVEFEVSYDPASKTLTVTPPSQTVSFTNTYTKAKTGSLTIEKRLEGIAETLDAGKTFSFTVTALDNTALAGSFTTNVSGTTVNFANGTANITVKHGTPVTINNLPIGKYTVKEATGTGYTLTDYDVSGEGTFEVTDGGNVTAPVTNARKTGSLTIEKRLEGIAGTLDAGKTFTFTVTAPVDLALAGQSFTATGGDVTFTAGTGRSAAATVQVPAGKSVTIEGLPIGTYTVTETESMDHTYTFGNYTVAYSGGAAFASAAVPFKGNAGVTVTNTRKTGSLTIEKKLEGIAETLDAGKTFSFTVTALDETALAGSFTTNVSGTTANFANGTASITVKHGTPVTINGLPIGKYEVKETGDLGNYTVSGGGEVTVTAGGTVTAPVTNARKTGSLTIHKDLNGTKTSLDPDTFTMTVTAPEGLALAGQSFTATDGDVTFTAGAGGGATATVEVPVNGSVTIEGLPLGTYTVTEKNSNDYTFTVTGGNAEVTDGGNANVTVANIRKTGKLTVHKTVDGTPAAGDAKVFDFTVTLTPAVDATYSGVEFNGGVGHFTLEDGQDRIIELPAGMGYVVDETPVPAHYTKSSTTPSGKITAGKTDTVTFTNKYQSALGTLRLYKTVTDAPASEKDRLFTFTVKADDTSLEGTFNGVKFAGGTATVTLAAGGEITIPRLPAGTYTVEETAVDIDGDPETHDDVTDLAGYTVSHTVKAAGGAETGASAAKTDSFEIVRDGVTDVTFTNARKPYDLTLHKTVSRDPQDTGTEPIPMDNAFGFKVTFKDASGQELPASDTFDYTLEYTDGSTTRTFYGTVASGGQVFLTNRDILIIKGLPAGTQYTVEEVTYNSTLYTPGAPPANASGTLNGPVDVTFTNTYKSSSIPGKDTLYADLSLTKDIRTAANHTLDKEGQHTVGMLYSWTEPYTGNFTPVQIPVKLTLEAGNAEHELSNNGGLGYVFAFDVEANNSAVDVGSGIALIAVPADILTNESSVTYGDGTDATVYIEVYVDTQYTSSAGTTPYTVTVTEKTLGGDASFTPDRTPQEVEITVDNIGKVTAQRKTDNSEFIEFKNTYTGKVSNGDPVDIPLPKSEGTNRAYAYFDNVPLGGQFDYSRKFTLPVSNTGNTVVHLFELDNSSYTFKGTDPYTGIGKFYPSSEGGVLTFSKADLQGYDKNNHANLGNMTFINIPDPAPVSLALQVDTWLDADDGKTPLPAGSYDFAYDVDANGDGKFEDTSPETITVADGNTKPSEDVLHDPPHLFTFDREGTYTYYLQGQECGNGRITYDTDKHAVRIKIVVDTDIDSPTDGDLKVESVKWDTWDTAEEDMDSAPPSEEKYNDADGDGQPDDKDQPVADIYLLPVRNTYTAPVFDVTMPFTKVFELAEGSEDPKDTTAAYTFNFSLTPVDGAPAPAGAEVPVRVSVPTAAAKQEATGTFTIRGLPMDPGAKYAYTLREQVPAAAADKPIGYDSESSYTVSFTVKGDAKAVTVVIEDAAGSLLHQHELPMEGAADLVIDMKDVVKTLSFTNTYTPPEPNTSDPGKPGGKPSDPDPHPEEPQPAAEEEDDTPAPTPAPVAVSVPRTADDMPLGAVWALFAASAAALAGLAAIRLRRRKSK